MSTEFEDEAQEQAHVAVRHVAEMCTCYRETLIRENIPEDLADLMTRDYATLLWSSIMNLNIRHE